MRGLHLHVAELTDGEVQVLKRLSSLIGVIYTSKLPQSTANVKGDSVRRYVSTFGTDCPYHVY